MNWFNVLKTLALITFIILLNSRCYIAAAENGEIRKNAAGDNMLESDDTASSMAAKRAWQQLQGGWGKRFASDDELSDERLDNQQIKVNDNNLEYFYGPRLSSQTEKRAWNSMNRGWGKRDWGQLRSNGWGKKREPANWNNLRGLWGKRSSPQSISMEK
jgi:hypothetical protein